MHKKNDHKTVLRCAMNQTQEGNGHYYQEPQDENILGIQEIS